MNATREHTSPPQEAPLRCDTVVIGGGQTGLCVGYLLKQQGRDFVILDAGARIGDTWRKRWDSLRLFTPARYNGLPGLPFPADGDAFPTKDEMADYLEGYAAHFNLPVRLNARVERLFKQGDTYIVMAGNQRYEARNVIVAMAGYQQPRVPSFARELSPEIVQLHSSEYHNPEQLKHGGVLLVGAANSGAEIAIETARSHQTWLAGRHPGHVPFRIESLAARLLLIRLVLRLLFHRLLTVRTPMGRNARVKNRGRGVPLVRTKPIDLINAGVERVGRVEGVRDGRPLLDDGRVLDVANVIWSTGYRHDLSWIDLPIHGEHEPRHERGVVADAPGLYFVGLHFQYAVSSTMVHGVERDAVFVTQELDRRSPVAEAGLPAAAHTLASR